MSSMNSKSFRRSDRQRAGLRGNVKTCVDEFSITEFSEDENIFFWQSNICGGCKSEGQYCYDDSGRILSMQGGTGDHTDNFNTSTGEEYASETFLLDQGENGLRFRQL